ncbi:MAG: tetratricopeptide repeat protein [candidate division Zixibacteria bacterium]|nr:tetratricopeptide repeat protein [candidate division Zixibacteria bacterium]
MESQRSYDRRMIRFLIYMLFIIPLFLPGNARAYEEFIPVLKKVTGHPGIDFEPSVSPRGDKIAFTTGRDGDFNIYIKSTGRGIPVRLTNHTSADYSPCWASNGKSVYFVSRRDDALGEIYRYTISTGSTRRITENKGYDIEPAVSPEKKLIAFSSDRDLPGQQDIYVADANGKDVRRITINGGINPCWSPDGNYIAYIALDTTGLGHNNILAVSDLQGNIEYLDTGDGPVMHPHFSPGGNIIYYTKYAVDTNGDGALNIDDSPLVCGYFRDKQESVKLIFRETGVSYPRPGIENKWAYVAVDDNGEENVARFDMGRLLNIYSYPESLVTYSENLSGAPERYQRLAAIQYLESYYKLYPDEPAAMEAFLRCGYLYMREGLYREAQRTWESITESDADSTLKGLAELYLVELDTEKRWELDSRAATRRALRAIDDILEDYAGDRRVEAEAYYLRGMVNFRYGNFEDALYSFNLAAENYPDIVDVVCESHLRIVDVYRTINPEDRLSNARNYINTIREFPEANAFTDSAVNYAIYQYSDAPVNERVEGIRALLREFPDNQVLQARGEFEIGKAYRDRGNLLGAIDQFTSVYLSYPGTGEISAKARLNAAELSIIAGDRQTGISELNELLDADGLSNQLYESAEEILYRTYLKEADSIFNSGEYSKARIKFEELIGRFSDRGDCHWGFVKCCEALDDLSYADKGYDRWLDSNEEDRGFLYGKSILLISRYDQSGSKSRLRDAKELLEDLNEEYFEWIFPYVALGEVYLKMEVAGMEAEESGFAERAIDVSLLGIETIGEETPEKVEYHLYLNLATGYYHIGQFSQAYSYYDRCYQFVEKGGDEKLKIDFLWNLGDAAMQIDSLFIATDCMEQLLRIAERKGDTNFRLRIFRKLGLVYMLMEDFDESRYYFDQVLDIYKSREDKKGIAQVHKALAANEYIDREYRSCIKYASISDSIYSSLSPRTDLKTRGKLMGRFILIPEYFQLAELEEFKIGGSFYPRGFPYNLNQRLLRSYISRSYSELGKIDSAAVWMKDKIELERDSDDDKAAGITANELANLFLYSGNPDSAAAYYRRAIDLAEDAELLPGVAINAINLYNLLLSIPELREGYPRGEIKKIERHLSDGLTELPGAASPLKMYSYCALASGFYLEAMGIESEDSSDVLLEKAVEYFNVADEIASILKDTYSQTAIRRNKGLVYAHKKDYELADNQLNQAQRLARENGYNDLLWRINLDLGITNPQSYREDEYFNSSAEILKTIRGAKNPFALPEEEYSLRKSYEIYLKYLIDRGEERKAFEAMELYRSMSLAGEFARYPVRDFRSELHKVYWTNISYLDEMVDSLGTMIRAYEVRLDNLTIEEKNALDSLKVELGDMSIELDEELKKIIENFPSLSPLIYPTTPDDSMVSVLLGEDEGLLLEYHVFDDGLGIWKHNGDSVTFQFREIDEDSLEGLVFIANNSLDSDSLDEASSLLFDLMFAEFQEDIENVGYAVLIPDGFLYDIPFSRIGRDGLALADMCDYSISSSAVMAVNGYQNRRVPSEGVMVISGPGEAEKWGEFAWAGEDSIPSALANYGVLVFHDGMEPQTGFPLGTRLVTPAGGRRLSDFLTFELNCEAAILNTGHVDKAYETLPALQAALNYAGAPSIVLTREKVPDSVFNQFAQLCISYLDDYNVAGAVGAARYDIRERYPGYNYWSSFELLGYKGMTNDEELEYAREQFNRIIQKAIIAQREGSWPDALEYYENAYFLTDKLELDDDKIIAILGGAVNAAFKSEKFALAEDYQKKIMRIQRKREDEQGQLESYMLLRVISEGGRFFTKAAAYHRMYYAFKNEIGDTTDTSAEGFLKIADLYNRDGNFFRGLREADSALAIANRAADSVVLAHVYYVRGTLLLNQGKYLESSNSLEKAEEYLGRYASADSVAAADQLLSTAYFRLGLYEKARRAALKAYDYFMGIDDTANAARCAQLLASAMWGNGDFDNALEMARFASGYYFSADEPSGYLDSKLIEALILIYSGMSEEGEDLLREGLETAEEVESELHKTVFAENLARHYLRRGYYKAAVDHFRLALTYSAGEKKEEPRIEMLLDLAAAAGFEEGWDSAEKVLEEADSLVTGLGNPFYSSKRDLVTAYIMDSTGKTSSAQDVLRDMLADKELANFPDIYWRTLYLLAKVRYSKKDTEESVEYLQRAQKALESAPVKTRNEIYRSRLPFDPGDVYELLGRSYYQDGDSRLALESFQKAAHYRQVSVISSFDIEFKNPRVDSLVSAIGGYREQLNALANLARLNREDSAAVRFEGEFFEQDYKNVINRLAEINMGVYLICDVPPVDFDFILEVSKAKPLIFYYTAGDELYRFFLADGEISAFKQELEEDIRELNRQLYYRIISLAGTSEIDSSLTGILFTGLEDSLKTMEKMSVIPLGMTSPMPFNHLIYAMTKPGIPEVNIYPSLYDIQPIPDSALTSEPMTISFSSGDKKVVDYYGMTMERVKIRGKLDLKEKGTDSVPDSANVDFTLSVSGLEEKAGTPLYYMINGVGVDDSSGLRLKDILSARKASGYYADLAGVGFLPVGMSPGKLSIAWRLMLSAGYKGFIMPYWNIDDFDGAYFFKEYFHELEKTGILRAFSNAQRLVKNERLLEQSYRWSGYHFVGSGD